MWVVLEKRNFAILTLSGGQQVQLRKGQPYEITQQEWDLQPSQLRSLFDVRSGDGDPMPEGGPGAPGKSAYELAVEEGFVGDVNDWLASLVGPPGDDAEAGEYELGYVENESGVTQVIGTALNATVTDMILVVPPQTRPVWVEFCFAIDVTTAPAAGTSGTVHGVVMDGADPVAVAGGSITIEAAGVDGIFTVQGKGRLGPTAVEKTLRVDVFRGANSSFRANVMNGAIALGWRSWFTAYVR